MSVRTLANSCLDACQSLAWAYDGQTPPFSLAKILQHFGIRFVRTRRLDRDARIILENKVAIIELNSLFPSVRHRLGIAHEIGHLIVNESLGRRRFEPCVGDEETESLCDL